MHRVFVNYRTGHGDGSATLIERELTRRFGSGKVFRASSSIPAGDDFHKAILQTLRRCDVLLAVIAPGWPGALNRKGGTALDDEDDWVRKEILEAFAFGVRVIPVLVGSTPRLTESDLPPELNRLARCHGRRFSHEDVDGDIDRLADELVTLVPGLADEAASAPEPAPGSAAPDRPTTSSAAIVVSDRLTVNGDLFGGGKYGSAR